MKIAIPVEHGLIGGPGESSEILILDSDSDNAIVEKYENPALTASSARGISMINSVLDRGAEVLILGHIGQHAFSYAASRLKIYSATDMDVETAIREFKEGRLQILKEALHGSGHHHH